VIVFRGRANGLASGTDVFNGVVTLNAMIWPVVSGKLGVPCGKGPFAVFVMMTVFPANFEKSTTMSARSAGAMRTWSSATGAASRPPSVPIWKNGWEDPCCTSKRRL
jgi:hypothetical protein